MRRKRKRLPSEPSPTARKIRLPYPKDRDGNPLCRWCRGVVRAPRLSWCSDKCVTEYRERYDARYQKRLVRKRDRGICQLCGLDVAKLERAVRAALKTSRAEALRVLVGHEGYRATDLRVRRGRIRPLWQMDHIVPVVEGGGGTGTENLRCLCIPCHRRETAKLMARRRAAKKADRSQADPRSSSPKKRSRGRTAG